MVVSNILMAVVMIIVATVYCKVMFGRARHTQGYLNELPWNYNHMGWDIHYRK